ncbi:ParB/RepB/Spo0J family partition protein [Cupriavidus sp. AU9028]|uniref:ParB/RepB/Spo0J family partition protein n=1 Tax=Cupriavidus sp. AU9028 TaxID=2871157 RepID=UPI001C9509E5|nr:ParB/RepB/Spo0J family partition protein [Cupriavidus sp. AU9028]MBY4898629.1 ParB/RepB/Spo0J family partition protein [Cupriavidus sp. AU9028]
MSLREKLAAKAGSIKVTPEDLEKAAARGPLPPRTAPGQLMHMQGKVERQAAEIAELRAQLEAAHRIGGAVDIPLDQLHEVPGRRRYMPPEKYAELRENLRHNKLVHPVSVCPRAEGGFEIVSGHHRIDAFRDLGRATIRCVLGDLSSEEADAGAFYANLMQSDLTDFEKFRKFDELLARQPGKTQASIAEQAGVSEATLSQLLSFRHLPAEVLQLLDDQPGLLGANAGYDLAAATRDGRSERVIDAVKLLADRKIDQQQAVRMARSEPQKAKAAAVATGFKVKAGKATWCDVRIAKKVMRIEFRSEDEAQAVQEAIREHLERLAKTASSEDAKR